MGNIIYYDFENFRLDLVNEQLLKDNQSIPLTHKAFKTLLILVQNYGQLVRKEDIINKIWQDSFVEEANLTQNIYVLRKTLGNNKHGKPFIETIPKRGYCFVGEVQKISALEPSFATHLRADDAVLNEQYIYVNEEDKRIHASGGFHISENPQNAFVKPISATKTAKTKFFSTPLFIIICLISILGIGIFLYQRYQPVKTPEVKSIAVLPFKPIGEESTNAKMGFGIADAVITNLSKQQKIPVRPTSAVFQFTEKNFDPVIAGKELGVDSVLEGTVQRDGEWVRVSVRLIKIADGSTLWAETFDEKFTYIFALQDSISTKVAKALSFNLSAKQEEQLTAHTTTNTEAYQAYQLGIYFWNKRTKEDLEKAVVYFQKAVQADGNYALAYAMLADSYNMLHYYGFVENSKETIDKADEAAQKALTLNDSIPESQIANSYVQLAKYRNFDAAVTALERAIKLSPYNATARIRYGWQLLRLGNLDGTLEQMRIAQSNDPLSPVSNSALCSVLLLKKNYAEALRFSEKAVELQANAPMIRIQLASVYFLNGRTDEAIKILREESKNPHNRSDALAGLAFIYAKTGKIQESEEIYSQLKNDHEMTTKYTDLSLIAFTLGKKIEALEYFKIMLQKSNNRLSLAIMSDPYWEDLMKDEDFKKLIPSQN